MGIFASIFIATGALATQFSCLFALDSAARAAD